MISIQSFGFNAMFDAYWVLNVSSTKFEFSSSDDKSGACIFGSFFSTYKDFTTPVKLEMYSKIIRYSDSKVDEVYGYNSSSQLDYSALFYVVDQIKITSLNYIESVSSACLNISVNVFLNPVQIPSSLLKNTKCTLTEYIELYSILQGEAASQLTSRNMVTITDIAGYLHNIEWVFQINLNDASKYTISIDISSFYSEFNSRLISIIQNPKIINVNSLTYMYDYSIVGSKSEDIMFQIIYEGWSNLSWKFQTKTQSSLSTIRNSQAIFLKNIDTGPLGSQLIDEVSILQYSWAIDCFIISKFAGF